MLAAANARALDAVTNEQYLDVLEGIAISFDPNYKVLSSSYPWIARKVLTDSSPQLRSTLQALLYKEGLFRIDRLESLLSELSRIYGDQENLKFALPEVLIVSLRARIEQSQLKRETVDTSSSVVIKQMLKFTLDEKGAFVREVLLQELAKGGKDLKVVEKEKSSLEETLLVLYQLPSIQEFWPILSMIPELSPESQQQLLRLPADLAGRLASRAAARTLRRVII
ncbi:hypothetical protein ACLOJK_028911 [Asimina triloba]